jgi:hypothetical protein
MIKNRTDYFLYGSLLVLFIFSLLLTSCEQVQPEYYQGIPVVAGYSYHLSGRTDRVEGYLVKINDLKSLGSPGLVFLAKGIDVNDGAYVMMNGNRYDIPPILEETAGQAALPSDQEMGKRGFYALSQRDDLLGKIVVPLKLEDLKTGINNVTFYKGDNSDGYEVSDARIQTVDNKIAEVVGVTYLIIARGRPAAISDFDFVMNYRGENLRLESEVPAWAKRGKIRFYRAGNDMEHLDRMFEMYKEAAITKVAVHVPADTKSEEYTRVKAFVDRCHENGIKTTAFFSLGGIRLASVIMNPELREYISKDEYGQLRWREPGGTFLADLKNQGYINMMLKNVKAALDAGIDELYYDYAIGGTGEVLNFLSKVRELIDKEGKNLTIFGNCKGDLIVDDVCDLMKSEGTEEAGVFDGQWFHNVAQARFYYAVGFNWKPYESKYEGADPGVAHPGAHDIRDGMKYGWKRPIAEASAFQSFFAIAEAGDKLLDGWVQKDNELAMEIWNSIVTYNQFLAQNEDYYMDVRTVSKVGLVAPPVIPSFEVALTRVPLYNAMAELNIMYDVILLTRLDSEILAKYPAIVIPDIPYMDRDQLKLIQEYKNKGGKIYVIGSIPELAKLADIYSPTLLIQELQQKSKRKEFAKNICTLSGDPLVSIENANYIITNIVKKQGTDRFIIYFVNYSDFKDNVKVKINLEGFIDEVNKDKIVLLSPDNVPLDLRDISVNGSQIEFTIPKIEIYDVVAIN